jgi:hypothetical protein
MKTKVMLCALFLLSLSFIAASSSDAEFGLEGCSDGTLIGNCSLDSTPQYCNSQGNFVQVLAPECYGKDSCCPQGYECDGAVGCKLIPVACQVHTTDTLCHSDLNANCFWVNTTGEGYCTDDLREGSCDSYQSEPSCNTDDFNLGKIGTGTEVCGTYTSEGMTIQQESCHCEWDTNECVFAYTVVDTFYTGTPSEFTCRKSFTIGECNSGSQEVSWTVTATPAQSDSAVLQSAGCVADSQVRACGSSAVKLPGFSALALISAIGILTIFYLVKLGKIE